MRWISYLIEAKWERRCLKIDPARIWSTAVQSGASGMLHSRVLGIKDWLEWKWTALRQPLRPFRGTDARVWTLGVRLDLLYRSLCSHLHLKKCPKSDICMNTCLRLNEPAWHNLAANPKTENKPAWQNIIQVEFIVLSYPGTDLSETPTEYGLIWIKPADWNVLEKLQVERNSTRGFIVHSVEF